MSSNIVPSAAGPVTCSWRPSAISRSTVARPRAQVMPGPCDVDIGPGLDLKQQRIAGRSVPGAGWAQHRVDRHAQSRLGAFGRGVDGVARDVVTDHQHVDVGRDRSGLAVVAGGPGAEHHDPLRAEVRELLADDGLRSERDQRQLGQRRHRRAGGVRAHDTGATHLPGGQHTPTGQPRDLALDRRQRHPQLPGEVAHGPLAVRVQQDQGQQVALHSGTGRSARAPEQSLRINRR